MYRQLSFSTLGCPAWDFETIVARAAAMGFAAVEIRGVQDTLRIDQLAPFQAAAREGTQALLREAGVRICSVGTSVSFHDRTGFADALQEGRDALAVCGRVGIPAIRVFGDAGAWSPGRALPWQQVADGLLMLCDAARGYGDVQVWMEVHGCVNTVEMLGPILRQMDGHPAFGLIWDIQHSFRATGNDFMPFYTLIKPYTRHVHVKDGRQEGDGFVDTLPGEGQIDIAAIVRRMLADGYDGLFSFEWEKRWEPSLAPPEVAFPAYVRYMAPLLEEDMADA